MWLPVQQHDLLTSLPGLQQEQPALYENVTKNLNPEEKQVVEAAVHQADVIAQATAEAQAQVQAQLNGNAVLGQQ